MIKFMIRKDICSFLHTIPSDVHVVAATKYGDASDIKTLYEAGIRNVGENRVDALLNKQYQLGELKDLKWHFIGHLQRNKAKTVLNHIDCLHSLDSLKLASMIEEIREKPLDTFIEVSINLEENKNGVPYYEVEEFINKIKGYSKIHLVGFMMMTIKNSGDFASQFAKLRKLRDEMEDKCNIKLPYLSMGMSEDYIYAIQEGATHIRLGRILFD